LQHRIKRTQETSRTTPEVSQAFETINLGKQPGATITLDQVDIKILNILQENCQLSFRKIGNMLGLSGVMMAARIKNLEEKGVIKGYTTILDPVELGYDLTAIIYIQTEGGYLEEIEAEMGKAANIIGVYEVTGDFDIIAVAKIKDREGLNGMLKNLLVTPHIKKTMTNIALNVVKEDYKVKL
jgi:Lrp/AsnC family transcriptional regulator, regulator for asnA, asnC and gidA